MQSLAQKNFKNLPLYLYSFASPKDDTSLLWLPPLGVHDVTASIDWLTGMQISNMMYKPKKSWAPELKKQILDLKLPLDEHHPGYSSEVIFVSLPPGFRSTLGLIVTNCAWDSAETVIRDYTKASANFDQDINVQCLNIWSQPTPQGKIEWIEI